MPTRNYLKAVHELSCFLAYFRIWMRFKLLIHTSSLIGPVNHHNMFWNLEKRKTGQLIISTSTFQSHAVVVRQSPSCSRLTNVESKCSPRLLGTAIKTYNLFSTERKQGLIIKTIRVSAYHGDKDFIPIFSPQIAMSPLLNS